MTPGIYELLLKAPDGRERRTLVWLPNEDVRRDYFNKAQKRGLTIEIINKKQSMRIIEKNISSLEFIELRDFMQNCISESLNCVNQNDTESIAWYKDCSMDDYFTEWTEIWDDSDCAIGEGIDTIAHKFVLNDETRADFEKAFEQARDNAYNKYTNDHE